MPHCYPEKVIYMKRLLILLLASLPVGLQGQFRYDGNISDGDTLRRPFSASPVVSGETYRFAVIADRCGGERAGVFRRGAERVREYAPDFVLSVGDQIDGYTTDREYAMRQWAEFDTLCPLFGAPLFYLPGNHDYSNRELAALWDERFGCSYYGFRIGSSLFLMLNSEEPLGEGRTGISDRQAEYFASMLAREKSDGPLFVVMHTPLWVTGKDPNYNRLESLFLERKVTVFSGHTHRYYHACKKGRPHYNLATMGGDSPMRGVSMGEFDHFMLVEVCDGKVSVCNMSIDGTPIPLDAVNEQSRVPVELLVAEKWLHVIPTVADEPRADCLETGLVLTNPSEEPMQVTMHAPRIPGGRIEPESCVREVPARSNDTIPLRIRFDSMQEIDALSPIQIICRGSYRIGSREVAASAEKRWLIDCVRCCREVPTVVCVEDPFYVHEAWDWHSVQDGSFRFEVSIGADDRIALQITTADDNLITDRNPKSLQDRLVVLFTPEGGPTQRIELTEGTSVETPYQAECNAVENGLEARLYLPAKGLRRFNLNIGFIDCDNRLNTKPSQLWWRPWEMRANARADYGTFLIKRDE